MNGILAGQLDDQLAELRELDKCVEALLSGDRTATAVIMRGHLDEAIRRHEQIVDSLEHGVEVRGELRLVREFE